MVWLLLLPRVDLPRTKVLGSSITTIIVVCHTFFLLLITFSVHVLGGKVVNDDGSLDLLDEHLGWDVATAGFLP